MNRGKEKRKQEFEKEQCMLFNKKEGQKNTNCLENQPVPEIYAEGP